MHLTLMDFRYANCCRDIERWKAGTPGTRPLSILLVGDEHDLAVGEALQMLAIGALAVAFRGLHELIARDPAALVGDLLHDRDGQALCALYGTHAPKRALPDASTQTQGRAKRVKFGANHTVLSPNFAWILRP